ncbi:MAG: SMC-Scp complex subunit ScpB [Planctomycetes bacterium]|nr:SMC-Scp complex subunit ScpB [Planctomycetota bacterium]
MTATDLPAGPGNGDRGDPGENPETAGGTGEPADGRASGDDAVTPGPSAAGVVEALLLAAAEPLSVDRLRSLTSIDDGSELRAIIEGLRIEYERTGRAFQVEEVGGGFRILTRPEYAPWIANLRRRETEARLSPAAMETLAIIAYRQPILRADVEKVRGVDAGGALRTLLDRGLVKVVGRAEEPGAPMLYGTTRRFLEVFGLRSLKDLPKAESLNRPE